jgi:hypothetical protein
MIMTKADDMDDKSRFDVSSLSGALRWSRGAPKALFITFAFLVAAFASPVAGLLSINATDDVIDEVTGVPSADEPGPIIHSTTDGLTFSSGLSDVAAVWYAELESAYNETNATGATIQGEWYDFIDWFYGKQGSASKYTSFTVTGEYDPDASSYSVPILFTKSSQGTLTITWYDSSDPVKGGSETTFYWAYNAGTNRYVIGPTKSLGSQTQLAPISAGGLSLNYVRTIETNDYVITSVGSSPNFVPTISHGKHLPLLSLPASHTWYVLMDPPPGVHAEVYGFDLRVTATGL